MQKEKRAKEENDYLKSKQSAWQQFQNRNQTKRRSLVAQGVISDRTLSTNSSVWVLIDSFQEGQHFPYIRWSEANFWGSSD